MIWACGFSAAAGAFVSSDFDADYGAGLTDGWVGIECPNPGFVCGTDLLGPGDFSHQALGGSSGINPDGFIKSTDPGSGTAARIFAPAKFNDALQTGRRLTFDLVIFPDPNGGTQIDLIPPPILSVAGNGMLLVYLGPIPGFNTWTSYDVLLGDTGNAFGGEDSWFGWAGDAPFEVTNTMFDSVFADPNVRLSVTGEFIDDGENLFDSVGLDDVNLVPVPAALPLLFSALACLGFARRPNR